MDDNIRHYICYWFRINNNVRPTSMGNNGGNMKINKKYIKGLVLQEIEAFRDNRDIPSVTDYWLCNQIGYIDALLFLLDRHALRELFDEVHNKIRKRG
jgi:hypothetical protein